MHKHPTRKEQADTTREREVNRNRPNKKKKQPRMEHKQTPLGQGGGSNVAELNSLTHWKPLITQEPKPTKGKIKLIYESHTKEFNGKRLCWKFIEIISQT